MKTYTYLLNYQHQKTINKVLQFWDNANKEDVGILKKRRKLKN